MQKQIVRALVTDDDDSIRRLLVKLLMGEGFIADQARDGEDAIAKIATSKYDVILLDLMMPKVSGFEVIEHLERTEPGCSAKCIIVITAASNKDLEKLKRPSVFRVIRKPFDINELSAAVRDCVSI